MFLSRRIRKTYYEYKHELHEKSKPTKLFHPIQLNTEFNVNEYNYTQISKRLGRILQRAIRIA